MDNYSLCKNLINLVKDIFPNDSKFVFTENKYSKNWMCEINCKLNDNTNVSTKLYRKIEVVITKPALEDYGKSLNQEEAQEHFKRYIKYKFNQKPLQEKWLVRTNCINK